VYNVCSGDAYSIEQILAMLAELAGYRIEVDVNPAFVRANEVRHLVGCNRKLATAIGELGLIPLADTLEWM
jgi:nucleoside-diphosphate-sugar epimerase